MKKIASIFALSTLFASHAQALEVRLGGIGNGDKIPSQFAFCMPDGKGKTRDAGNINPSVSWSGAPANTKSFALLVVDPDVPASFDDANQEGKLLPANMPRQDFYHWVLVDIPANITSIRQGQDSTSHLEGGKQPGKRDYGVTGQNDYATFMKGSFGGYDGPCPPWNDARVHRYHFRVYALDVPTLGLSGNFNGRQAMEAIDKHTLAKAEITGTYTNRR